MGKVHQPLLFPMIPESGRAKPGRTPVKPQSSGSTAGRFFLALVALFLFAAMGYLLGLLIKALNIPLPRLPFRLY
jgi:hypothetical protein